MNLPPALAAEIIHWRRDLHRHPELGFCEFRSAALVAGVLQKFGWKVAAGREVIAPEARLGAPPPAEIAAARAEALREGADPAWVERFEDGLTGVVGIWDGGRPGPTVAFRFDLDALPLQESAEASHRPAREGFASSHPGRMHACGHDGHTAMGLGLAAFLPGLAAGWRGRVKLIFQPAEEGARGAAAMVAAGILADVDYFLAAHLGISALETGLCACGTHGFAPTTKLDARFIGKAAHAGVEPEAGRNALLAAATATVQLHALSRYGNGYSRVNVGVFEGGTARNIVADRASLKLEVRGETDAINDDMVVAATRVLRGAAEIHGVKVEVEIAGRAGAAACDPALVAVVRRAAESLPTARTVDSLPLGGSEDATLMMTAVQARGGRATYVLVGTPLSAGHHQTRFDFDETALAFGVGLGAATARELLGSE